MPAIEGGFDASEVSPEVDFTIPAGKYKAIITSSEHKPTSAGDGEMFVLDIQVIDGEHKGAKLRDWILTRHPTERAVNSGKAKLSQICRAVNVMTPKDTTELHNIPLVVEVTLRKDEDSRVNNVRKYHKADTPEGQTFGADEVPF